MFQLFPLLRNSGPDSNGGVLKVERVPGQSVCSLAAGSQFFITLGCGPQFSIVSDKHEQTWFFLEQT